MSMVRKIGRRVPALPGLIALMALALLPACRGEEAKTGKVMQKISGPQRAAEQTAKTAAGKGEVQGPASAELMPLEVPVPEQPAETLAPVSTRDPFRSFIEIKERAREEEKPVQILTPLQKYSLDQLKVVGIVEGLQARKALLEDDVGKGYVVNPGDYVGNQGGRISVIDSDRIVIEESYQDALGTIKVRRITKRLHPTEEGNS